MSEVNGELGVYDILLFDGDCMLCNRMVQFVIRRDPRARYRFAALGSEAGRRIVAEAAPHMHSALSPGHGDSSSGGTFILIRNGAAYTRSRAALETVRKLRGAWPLLYAFIAVPSPIRDWVYHFVARNRYRWFGRKSEACMLPAKNTADRFIQ